MPRYSGPIVDVDIHHRAKRDQEVFQYLPLRWREYAEGMGIAPMPLRAPNGTISKMMEHGSRLASAVPPDGSTPGSDYPTLRSQLLDRFGYFRGILTHDVGDYGQHLNRYFATALVQAANDWNIEHWLNLDDRLYSVIAISSGSPTEAAAEIRRVGGHPKLVSVLFAGNGLGRPLGDPLFDPIYEAAEDMGLSIAVHVGVSRPSSQIMYAGGAMSSGIAGTSQFSQEAMSIVTSLIVHGTFEKFPSLKVVIKEFGTAWLPAVIWGMDHQYEQLRFESPWVKRWPSEYIHEHVRLATQPFEESPDPQQMIDLMEAVDGIEDILCFSSDYPHLTFDDPTYIAKLIPSAWHRKVFVDNACGVYGWTAPTDKNMLAATAPAET